MARYISAREARTQFVELTEGLRFTGDPLIVERDGQPVVALVSVEDLAALERLRRRDGANAFSRLAVEAAREITALEAPEPDLVGAGH